METLNLPLILLIMAIISGALLYFLPNWQAKRLVRTSVSERRFTIENEARRTLATILGGAALLANLYLTSRQLGIDDTAQITDRYIRAVEQLGAVDHENIAARIGAIYALARIARDSKADHAPIMALLSAFVRERSAAIRRTNGDPPPPAPEEIRAALVVLGQRNLTNEDSALVPLDLSNAYLAGVNLDGAHLEYASLRGSNLYKASLRGAFLCGANFTDAELSGADLSEADLRLVDLTGASLTGYSDRLRGADAQVAVVRGARFDGARMELMNHFPLDVTSRFWADLAMQASANLAGISPAAETAAPQLVTRLHSRVILSPSTKINDLGYERATVAAWEADIDRAFPGGVRDPGCSSVGSAARLKGTN